MCTGRDVLSKAVLMHEGLINRVCLMDGGGEGKCANPFQFIVDQVMVASPGEVVSDERMFTRAGGAGV